MQQLIAPFRTKVLFNNMKLVETKCKRCEKLIITNQNPIYGLDRFNGALGRICTDCMVPAEKVLLVETMTKGITEKIMERRKNLN